VTRVLFVCAGNTCRSPMAEALAARLARERGLDWSVSSAGLTAADGAPMTAAARRVLEARGLDGSAHRARRVDEARMAESDRVLTMTRAQKDALAARFPAHAAKLAVLREAAGLGGDVEDPIGRPDAAYEECAAGLEDALDRLTRRNAHV
jgi:protein-tyrosine phosphatase